MKSSTSEPIREKTELLSFTGIEKAFFGVKVLRGVSFSAGAGRMIGLVGENGAGKSTLMNILGGNLQPDAGSLQWDGQVYLPHSPQDAASRGIAFIHQELNLFPNLTVAENLFLTKFPRAPASPFIQRGEIHRRAAALLREIGLEVSPDQKVETLQSGERQLVEIAKALSLEARLIIFDEPTTSLSERETERLFALMERLRSKGLAIIFISHTLRDVFRLCDEIVVMRDGEVMASGPTREFTIEKVVTLMVGRTMSQLYPPRLSPQAAPRESNVPILEARRLTQPGVIQDVSFTLHRGEVIGLAGLMGAGRSELARILFGLDPMQQGEIWLDGRQLPGRLSPRGMIQRGVGFLTENRRSEGLCLDAAVADNFSLVTLRNFAGNLPGWISRPRLRDAVDRIRKVVNLDSKTANEQLVRTLSGGNQQKVVLGKWLLAQPKILLLDEPTRGIDVGTKFEIYGLIHQLANQGSGVLVISSEMEELIGICDRILVMRAGELVDDLPRAEFNRERILRAALGSTGRSSS